jgi:hypothetical protein
MADRGCRIEGCPNRHRAKGLCSTHYSALWYEEHSLGGAQSESQSGVTGEAEEESPWWTALLFGGVVGACLLVGGIALARVIERTRLASAHSET